jgi:hypothetical protein
LNGLPGPLQVGGPGKLADSVRVQAPRRRCIEAAVAIEQLVFLRPDRRELRDLLFLRHAREQILDALFDRDGSVAIAGALLGLRGGRGNQCDRQQAQVLHHIPPAADRGQAGAYSAD